MSETHITTPETESRREIPAKLKPLQENLSKEAVVGLDKLHIAYQDKMAEEWKTAFNRAFSEAKRSGVRTGEARRLATIEAQSKASEAAYASLKDQVQLVALEFMPDSDPAAPDFDPDVYGEKYNAVYDAVLEAAEMDATEWAGDQKDDGTLEGNGVMHDLLDEATEKEAPEADPDEPDEPEAPEPPDPLEKEDKLSPELKEMKRHLKESRRRKRQASATLQSIPFWRFKDRKAAKQEYDEALESYRKKFEDYQKKLAAFRRSQGKTDDEVGSELIEMTNKYATKDIKKEKRLLLEMGGNWAKLAEWYGRQSRAKKILMGIGIGAVMGTGMGFLFGAVGAGAAVAAAGVAAGRFARSYAIGMSSLYSQQQPNIPRFDGTVVDPHRHTLWELGGNYLVRRSDEVIEESNRIRRRAIGTAMASVALGATAGSLINLAGEHASDTAVGRVPHEIFHNDDNPIAKGVGRVETGTADAPVNPTDQVRDILENNPKAAKLLDNPNFFQNGKFNIPVRHGDGFIRLSERYGLSGGQREKMMEIVAKQRGETYQYGTDLRLNYNDGKLQFTPAQMKAIWSAK